MNGSRSVEFLTSPLENILPHHVIGRDPRDLARNLCDLISGKTSLRFHCLPHLHRNSSSANDLLKRHIRTKHRPDPIAKVMFSSTTKSPKWTGRENGYSACVAS